MWSENKIIRKCGCGPIAAFDLFCYLESEVYHSTIPSFITRDDYLLQMEDVQKRYFPLLYPSGINGFLLVLGLNRMFHDHRLPFRAKWAASGKRLLYNIQQMLSADIPVILSIGPNFPFFWQKHGVAFYRAGHIEAQQNASKIRGHYVTVLSISDEWLTISSWGKKYEISLLEYNEYVRKHSNYLFSNIVLIKKTG